MALVAVGAAMGTDGLDAAYDWVAQVDNPKTDADGDGLPDAVEVSGVTTEAGDTFVTNPKAADSDKDGLTDGEEAGALISATETRPVYRGVSDPGLKDSDGDRVTDGDEYFLGTDPQSDDSDGDELLDEDELDFGSDPLVDNADGDAYSDKEERERGSSPMAYDQRGWRAALNAALGALKFTLDGADKLSGGGKVKAAAKAIGAAKAAGVAASMAWDAVASRGWSAFDQDRLLDELFGDDLDKLGETLEGGKNEYVAYVGRTPDGTVAYVGITDDFKQLTADHGGLNDLSVVGGVDSLPLGQARALAEAVIKGEHDRMDDSGLANARHMIDPASNLYAPAMQWGGEQLSKTGFEW